MFWRQKPAIVMVGLFEHIKHVDKDYDSSTQSPPYFDVSSNVINVTSFVGQSSHLHCTVRDLGDKSVSWIRKSDLQVLTSNTFTFTGDQRFSAHMGSNDLWTLQLKFTQLKDAGEYQCQINTEPKISHSVFLYVKEAEARIDSPTNKEVHVQHQSRVQLRCVVDLGDQQESAAVFWYLNGKTIDWLGQTGPGRGVQVRYILLISWVENKSLQYLHKRFLF
ncbi:unnamed protein product [Lepeophtheirus salmonis]|uniref:(salmon louse) hypothetical protein n=1 Tax=Lepeophtheirus salmonis TaxID=72036 RepID=A0A7R8CSR7_LEPSM|nr:unnamed protein product [Lepeophtheirus salmonis]CAF2916622.1 unnamed protein product [Lepeophtheirus salmonis]